MNEQTVNVNQANAFNSTPIQIATQHNIEIEPFVCMLRNTGHNDLNRNFTNGSILHSTKLPKASEKRECSLAIQLT